MPAREVSSAFDVENLSLVTAEDIIVGVALWSLVAGQSPDVSSHLSAYLDIGNLDDMLKWLYSSGHTETSDIANLERCVR